MKRTLLSMLVLSMGTAVYAQPSKVQNAYIYMNDNDLVKAREEIEAAVVNEKTIGDAKAWYYRGQIYEGIYANSYMVNEKTKQQMFPQYIPLREGAVDKAVESFEKALALGGNRVDPNEIKAHHSDMARLAYQEGVNKYNEKNWERAGHYFGLAHKIREQYKSPTGEGADYESAYNAGIAYSLGNMNAEAEKYLRICIDHNFKAEESYLELARIYEKADKSKFAAILEEAKAKFPKNADILNAQINVFIDAGQYAEAKKTLNDAIALDPTNVTLLFVRGTIYDSEQRELFTAKKVAEGQKAFDAAAADYKKAIEIDPSNFDANYAIGALYYNRGAEQLNDANSIADDKQYKIAKDQAEATMKMALPYLEKAHEIDPTNVSTMTSLKELYARMNQMDKYNAINEKLKN